MLIGGAGADSLDGGLGSNTIDGGVGNDTIVVTSSTGASSLVGGEGNDTITGGSGNDTISGDDGADSLIGGDGNDVITGGAGGDYLEGGLGVDNLTGGTGSDTFVVHSFTATTATAQTKLAYDVISDASAGDIIQFGSAGLTSEAATFTSEAITLGAAATYSDYLDVAAAGAAGVIRWFQFGGNTYIVQDRSAGSSFVNGTDVVVELTGLVNVGGASYSETDTVFSLTLR